VESASAHATVLVIEDEEKMARVVERTLTAAGFAVRRAATGLDGLDLIRSSRFDLVVLDLLLPDVDGITVLATTADLSPDQAVLVLSALDDIRSKVMCLELGACDYVTKPFELSELIARVRLRTRERHRSASRGFLRSGRYVLDTQHRVIGDGEQTTELTAGEFMLLQYLMEHADVACTRDELLQHVWGYDFDPGTNVVDVCVRRLRAKLPANWITTVRNVGYSFVGA
jgi:two-component system OmpR family response regulator